MDGTSNTSFHHPGVMIENPLGPRGQNGRLLLTISTIILSSIASGKLLGSHRTTKDTIVLVLTVCFVNWRTLLPQVWHPSMLRAFALIVTSVSVELVVANIFTKNIKRPIHNSSEAVTGFLAPSLLPCRTTHTRLFPTKHSFSYSYLFVGVPVGWSGSAAGLLSTDRATTQDTWFSVHSDDYLARGHHTGGLAGKLEDFLLSQGVVKDRYRHAYLVTAPRFLGFSFNPVSFWYLYDEKFALAAMILEVNNTFDERRIYFLQGSHDQDADGVFRSIWKKDFHVSPFNDREGSYSVTVKKPTASTHGTEIDNNIVLRSSDEKAKIVARVYSEAPGIDAMTLSRFNGWRFVLTWCWVGFMTNPRILREARKLWAKKLQVFYRPEVLDTSIGRQASADETDIEPFFRAYLDHLVGQSKHLKMVYQPAAGLECGTSLTLPCASQPDGAEQEVDFRVLTPAFYTVVAASNSVAKAFGEACSSPPAGQAMAVSGKAILLHQLISETRTEVDARIPAVSLLERLVAYFRNGNIIGVTRSILGSIDTQKTHAMELSDLDSFVHTHFSRKEYRRYLRITLRLLTIDRLAFGITPLFGLYISVFRLSMVAAIAWMTQTTFLLTMNLVQCIMTFACSVCLHALACI